MSAAVKLKVKRSQQNKSFTNVATIQFEIVDSVDLPKEVFLFERRVTDVELGTTEDVPLGVCSVADLSTYPVDEPSESTTYQFFRKATATYRPPSWSIASQIEASTSEELFRLCEAVDIAQDMADEVITWIPAEPEEGS